MNAIFRKAALATAIAALIAGCGASRSSSSSKTHPLPSRQAQALTAQVQDTAAAQFNAAGRTTITAVHCVPQSAGDYTCNITYDFTQPTGTRVELAMAIPATCSGTRCSVQWATASNGRTIRHLGTDPRSPVAKCERALNASIQQFTSHAAQAEAAVACRHVHHGVYTP